MSAPVHRPRIVHVVVVVACVVVALVVGTLSLHTLERWVAPATAIVVSHVGALILLGFLLKWRFRRGSPQSSDRGT